MDDHRINDWDGSYVLSTRLAGVALPLSETRAAALLTRWMHEEPSRTQIRHVMLCAAGSPLSSTVSDAELLRYLTVRVEAGSLFLGRHVALARGGTESVIAPMPAEGGDADEGEAAQEEERIRPCDFETIVIKCKHMGSDARSLADARFWRSGGNDLDNLPPPASGRAYTKVIEVVGYHEERKADDISIVLEGGPGYTCASTHPKVTIKDSRGTQQVFEGQTSVDFKALCRALPAPATAYVNPFSLILYHFFPTQTLNLYNIDVESCGRLDDGSYGFGRSQQRVRVYPSDLYKMKLSVPALKKRTYERARNTRSDGTVVDTRESTKQSLLAGEKETSSHTESLSDAAYKVESEYKYQTRQGGASETKSAALDAKNNLTVSHEEKDLKPIGHPGVDVAASFSITRNGGDLKEAALLGKFINSLVNIQNEIQSIMNFIRDFQPQVGWKFVFEMELFKGDLSYEWGYKEWNDHTVYEWWKFQVDMTLFSLSLDLSFGADFKVCGFGITVLVFGKVSLETKIAAAKEASPADSRPWALEASAEPKGELGIRSALGADWVKAEGKLTVGLAFAGKCACSTKEPFHIDWNLDFGGVKAVVTGKVKWVGSIERTWTVVKPKKNWKKGRFPGGDPEAKILPGQAAA